MSLYKSQRQRRQEKRNRPYNVSKRGVRDDYIDKQILVIHQAMVEKLIAQPALVADVIKQVEARKETGKLNYSGYLTWISLLENIENHDWFRKGVLEDSPRMKRLRRKTPLVNILTEQERQQALTQGAIGEIDDPDILFL
ncbi:hypothetical protein [Thalassotalea agarivorans]|uniref:Uncharacterized protein n=1 Tax=Thalassotalea agarivorans TaxID=349064 RepID=A0A1I0GT34_THASX|nr:hypothetical protein [Thalassotalea agarivorans]SET74312.1 hypothetical protein SAMN05660429_02550 [Thalassotalea agarivorans]